MSEQSLPAYSVRPGVCRRNGDEVNPDAQSECRLTAAECDGLSYGLNWVSALEKWNRPGPYSGCPSRKALLEAELGHCLSGPPEGSSYDCSPNAESCFPSASPEARYVHPGTNESLADCTVATTLFGSCGGGECRWSPAHCPSQSPWTFPDPACDCTRVRTGACVSNTNPADTFMCAVDERACNPTLASYVPVDKVESTLGVVCTLCPPPSDTASTPTLAPSIVVLVSPSPTIGVVGNKHNNLRKNPSSNNDNTVWWVAGVAGAVCLCLVVGVTVGAKWYRKKYPPPSKKKKRKTDDSAPTQGISVVANEKDDISVL